MSFLITKNNTVPNNKQLMQEMFKSTDELFNMNEDTNDSQAVMEEEVEDQDASQQASQIPSPILPSPPPIISVPSRKDAATEGNNNNGSSNNRRSSVSNNNNHSSSSTSGSKNNGNRVAFKEPVAVIQTPSKEASNRNDTSTITTTTTTPVGKEGGNKASAKSVPKNNNTGVNRVIKEAVSNATIAIATLSGSNAALSANTNAIPVGSTVTTRKRKANNTIEQNTANKAAKIPSAATMTTTKTTTTASKVNATPNGTKAKPSGNSNNNSNNNNSNNNVSKMDKVVSKKIDAIVDVMNKRMKAGESNGNKEKIVADAKNAQVKHKWLTPSYVCRIIQEEILSAVMRTNMLNIGLEKMIVKIFSNFFNRKYCDKNHINLIVPDMEVELQKKGVKQEQENKVSIKIPINNAINMFIDKPENLISFTILDKENNIPLEKEYENLALEYLSECSIKEISLREMFCLFLKIKYSFVTQYEEVKNVSNNNATKN